MQVVSTKAAAQRLSRNRQRNTRMPLLSEDKTRFSSITIAFPQFEGHFKGKYIEIRECTCSYERRYLQSPYPKKYFFISEIPPFLLQNHS